MKKYFKNNYLPFVLGVAACHAPWLCAQSFPSKPIRLVIPFSPGAASDFLGRIIGAKLGERYGQQVVNDNRPGAGGVVGSTIVAKASPERIARQGVTIAHVAPEQLAATLKNDYVRFRKVVADTGLKPQ